MPTPVFELGVDWDADGHFTGNDIITGYVLNTHPLKARRGRDYPSQLIGKSTAGSLSCRLLNTDRRFSPDNASSPLYGKIVPKRRTRLLGSVVRDTFDRSNAAALGSASDTGQTWTEAGDGFEIVSLKAAPEGTGNAVAWAESGLADVVLEVTLTLPANNSEWCGLAFRVTDADNFFLFGLKRNGAGLFDGALKKFVAGVDTALDSISGSCAGVTGDTVTIRVEVYGETIYTYTDGTLRFTGTDDFQETATLHGMASRADADQEANRLEDFLVYAALWSGHLSEIKPDPAVGRLQTALLLAFGPIAIVNVPGIYIPMTTAILTGAAFDDVLDALDWSATLRTVDTGQTTMSRWWSGGVSGLKALRDLENTEGGFVREGRWGEMGLEDRHHRLKGAHLVSQATFSDAAGAALPYQAAKPGEPLRELYNYISVPVYTYTVGALAVLWTLAEIGASSPVIYPGLSRTFIARYPDRRTSAEVVGVDAWTTPVATTDYTANSASDGSGTNLTGSVSVSVVKRDTEISITLTNNHATLPAFVTFLRARGTPITVEDPVTIAAEDATSQAAYGLRTYELPAEGIPHTLEAEDRVGFELSVRKDPINVLPIVYQANRSAGALVQAMTRDVSDRINIVANGTGLNQTGLGISAEHFIEAVEYTVVRGVMTVGYELSLATVYSGFIVLDFGPGLDTGRLGY